MQSTKKTKALGKNSLNDFTPISLYYAHDAILSKNGELIKVIKISEPVESSVISRAILEFLSSLGQDDISIWITTIRSDSCDVFKTDFYEKEKFTAYEFERKFLESSGIKFFENELFISVVMHDHVNITSFKNILSLVSEFDKKFYTKRLDSVYKRLNTRVQRLMLALSSFSPRLLSIKEVDGKYFSEIETLFSRISKSSKSPEILNKIDISSRLIKNKGIAFLENKAILNSNQDTETSATLFTLKSHGILKNNISADLLSSNFETIVTEIIIPRKRLKKTYNSYLRNIRDFARFAKISQDKNLNDHIPIIQSQNKYFLKQTTFMVLGPKDDIDYIASKMNQKFIKHSIQAYRENIAIEEVFWSQFPGNFTFTTRLSPVCPSQLCNFNNSLVRSTDWLNSISLPDYGFSGEHFTINQKEKNVCTIFSNNDSSECFVQFITISLSKFPNLKIINFFPKQVISTALTKKDTLLFGVLTTIQKDILSQLTQEYLSIVKLDVIDKEFSEILIESFTTKKQEFNLVNLASYLTEKNIIEEDLNQIISQNKNEGTYFYSTENMSESQYLKLITLHCMIGAIDKIINGNDHLIQCGNFDILVKEEQYIQQITKILRLATTYDLYLNIYYGGLDDLVTKYYLKRINMLIIFLLNGSQKDLFNMKSLAFTTEIKNYLGYLVDKKLTSIAVNFDGKTFFSIADIKKFLQSNNYLS